MKSIQKQLALATCTLLSQQAGAQGYENDWVVDSSYLSYTEADDRVEVHKVIGDVSGKLGDDDSVKLKVVHDTMSGATPTGAVESPNSSATFTGASGGAGFSAGGETAALAKFDDTRLSVNADWAHALNRTLTTTYGAAVSIENDYESYGGSAKLGKESSNRLTTYTAGIGYTTDTVFRVGEGDTPDPLGSLTDPNPDFFGKGERNTYEALAGVSRVINSRTVGEINVSFSVSEGYHTDPYKVISATDEDNRPVATFYESRPGTRQRTSVYTNLAHELKGKGDSLHASYRFYNDDWEITSHTFDFKYRNKLKRGQFLEPHLRLYWQSAAFFFSHSLEIDENLDPILPEDGYASADYRLDEMTSYTVGLKYGRAIGSSGKLRLRAEYIAKSFDEAEFDTTDAVILQASFKKYF